MDCDSQSVNPTSAELIHASHREPARSPGWTLWSNGCKLAVAEAGKSERLGSLRDARETTVWDGLFCFCVL